MEPYGAGEFLQGFLEEAGEHLSNIRQNLLRLEELQTGAGPSEAGAIEQEERLNEVFRSYHTLKGLAGMVGLQDAAVLSHALESALRSIQKREIRLDPEAIDRLISATSTLAQVVDSLRSPAGQPVSIAASLESLDLLGHPPGSQSAAPTQAQPEQRPQQELQGEAKPALPSSQAATLLPELTSYPDVLKGLGELEYKKIETAAREGQFFALAAFTSSAERAGRGENVDWVRQRFQEMATLIKAVPSITDGKICFYFLLASRQPLTADIPFVDEIIPLAAQVQSQEAPQLEAQPVRMQGDRLQSAVVRVELARLDELMRFTSELILLRSRFGDGLSRLDGNSKVVRRELQQTYQQFGRKLRDLRQAILRTRMVPLAETFNHMPLVVRDLARASHKEVRLVMEGGTAEVDKLLVERLLDPLIHLVRNAIIHGIETAEERASAGKPPAGSLALRAIPAGEHILIEVSDDGRGIDLNRIADRAVEMGWLPPGRMISAEEALEWITRPGFSTQATADLSAGRGIGLDVVHRMVRSFGGQLSLQTALGKGTTFRLRLPLTLVIIDALIVRCGRERYAVRRDTIERIIEIQPEQLARMEGGELLPSPAGFSLLYRLDRLFGAGPSLDGSLPGYGLVILPDATGREANSAAQQPILIVDRVLGIQEIVVQPVTDPLVAQPGIGGATEMGDGSVVLVIDIPSLLRMAKKEKS